MAIIAAVPWPGVSHWHAPSLHTLNHVGLCILRGHLSAVRNSVWKTSLLLLNDTEIKEIFPIIGDRAVEYNSNSEKQ